MSMLFNWRAMAERIMTIYGFGQLITEEEIRACVDDWAMDTNNRLSGWIRNMNHHSLDGEKFKVPFKFVKGRAGDTHGYVIVEATALAMGHLHEFYYSGEKAMESEHEKGKPLYEAAKKDEHLDADDKRILVLRQARERRAIEEMKMERELQEIEQRKREKLREGTETKSLLLSPL